MKTILIVDDDVYISGMLCRRLQSEGYDTVCAFSGTEALMVLNTKKIDLILLDLMLPGLTGEELLQKISDIPVIVLSAKSEIGGKVELLKNGAADYITKPFNEGIVEMRELILKLNRENQITILISSHILDELSRLATHYGFIDRGRTVKELSSEELETMLRKCTKVEVTNTAVLPRVLDKMGVEYKILSAAEADIYGEVNITDLALALNGEGCTVQSVKSHDESLENFYINLVGGGEHHD